MLTRRVDPCRAVLKIKKGCVHSPQGFPGGASGKVLPANAGDIKDMGSIPGRGRSPGGGHSSPLQYSCLENPHGQRSLEDHSPWGHQESDTSEHTTQYICMSHVILRAYCG